MQVDANKRQAEAPLAERDDPAKLARQVWEEMLSEKPNYSSGKAAPIKPDYVFPELHLSALGLHALNKRTLYLFSGPNGVNMSYEQLNHYSPDGSRHTYIGSSNKGSLELHWGPQQDQRYILAQRADKSWCGNYFSSEADGRICSDYHIKLANGELETVFHKAPNSNESERKIRFKMLKDGGLLIAGTGERPSDQFAILQKNKSASKDLAVLKTADLQLEIIGEQVSAPEIKSARDELLKAFEGKHTDSWTKFKFEANLTRLETLRLQQIEEQLLCQGTPAALARKQAAEQISETYKQVRRLLQQETNFADQKFDTLFGDINTRGRQAASCAEQIIDHAANPSEITQGRHPTCTAATMESRIYTRTPSQAARLVVDLACHGSYKSTRNNYECEIDKASIGKYHDSEQLVPADGHRGIASQIFQVGIANLMYRCNHQALIFSQREPDAFSETGDLLLNKKGAKLDDFPWSKPGWLQKTTAEVSGEESQPWIIGATQRDGKCIKVDNEAELEKTLQAAKSQGNLPLAILVFTDHEPLRAESGMEGELKGGAHILCISDYKAGRAACVYLDNLWESKTDHFNNKALTLRQTIQLTQDPTLLRLIRSTGWFK